MNRKQNARAQAASPNAGDSGVERFTSQSPPLLFLVFAGILLAYLALLTKNYYWDGVFFAQTIEDATGLNASLLHPNHLIYNVPGYLLYRLARGLGLQVRALQVLQVLNCFIGAVSAYLFFRILIGCFKSVYLSVVLTLFFALSATWWKFSTDADSYIPSVLFILLSFYLILPNKPARPFLVALTHALAMCFHQLAVLFFPVILVGILLQTSSDPARRRIVLLVKYGLTAFLLTFPLFYYSFYMITGTFSFKPFLRWVTTFSPEHGFTFNAWDNLTYTLRGHSRLFAGGRLGLLRELGSPFMIGMAGVIVVLAGLFFLKLIRHFSELKNAFTRALTNGKRFSSLRLLCVVWIACYLIFLFFFIPQNTFYRLFYLPGIIVLVGTFLAPYLSSADYVRRYRAAIFVALVATVNLTFSIYPSAQVRANPPLALGLEMNRVWLGGTIVVFAARNTDNALVRYFNPETIWVEVRRDSLDDQMEELRRSGARVWLDTTMIEFLEATPEGRRWLDSHAVKRPEYELVNSKYKLRFYEVNLDSLSTAREVRQAVSLSWYPDPLRQANSVSYF